MYVTSLKGSYNNAGGALALYSVKQFIVLTGNLL